MSCMKKDGKNSEIVDNDDPIRFGVPRKDSSRGAYFIKW